VEPVMAHLVESGKLSLQDVRAAEAALGQMKLGQMEKSPRSRKEKKP